MKKNVPKCPEKTMGKSGLRIKWKWEFMRRNKEYIEEFKEAQREKDPTKYWNRVEKYRFHGSLPDPNEPLTPAISWKLGEYFNRSNILTVSIHNESGTNTELNPPKDYLEKKGESLKIYGYGIDWEQTKTERGFLTYNETHWTVDSSYRGSEKLNEENCPRSFTLNVRVDPTSQVENARKQVTDTFNELWDVIANAQRSLQKGKSLKPLRPQWDVYAKYLQVYDLRTQYPEMEWSEIAKRIFPDEVEKDRKPVHRKIRKTELAFKTTIDKVRYYWREADKMINKEGWKKI